MWGVLLLHLRFLEDEGRWQTRLGKGVLQDEGRWRTKHCFLSMGLGDVSDISGKGSNLTVI